MQIQSSIRKRLINALVFLAIIPLLLVGLILSWHSYIVQKEQVKELQQALTLQLSKTLSLYFQEQEQKIASLLRANYLPVMSYEQLYETLSKFLSSNKDETHGYTFNEAVLLDTEGKELVRLSRTRFFNKADLSARSDLEEFLAPLRTRKTYYGPVYFAGVTGEPAMKISVPVRDVRSLDISGILVTELNLMPMRDVVTEAQIGKQGIAYIVDDSGKIVVHKNPSVVFKNTLFQPPRTPQIMPGLSGASAVVATEPIRLNNRKISVVTEIPASAALSELKQSLVIIISFIILTIAGATFLGFVIVRHTIRPMESLAATARAISKGDFQQKAKVESMDEFGDLAEAFNSMTAKLMETIAALEKEKKFVDTAIEALAHPFYVIDANDYTIKLANSAANFGPLSKESKCYRLTHHADSPCGGPEHPCTIDEVRKSKKPVVLEHLHCQNNADEEARIYEVYGFPIFDENGEVSQIIEYNLDISHRKELEEQLLQSQKLEGIGRLAGGVAHDFNNLLTPIIGYSELALKRIAKDDPLRSRIQIIHESGKRGASLTRQLLSFSRKQVMEMKTIDLNQLIENLAKMLNRLIGEDIEMTMVLSPIGTIKADPGQIEQIIMNLVVNARDAMRQGGKLVIETDSIVLDEEYCKAHADVTPGSYVILCVTDSGKGMNQETQEKIFDPFFTTKKKGEGTGLGLSTVYGIVKQHKGHIYVYSECDCGTTFKIYLPEKKDAVAEDLALGKDVVLPRGTETILVVDDELSIRQLVCDTLRPLGYDVLEADCGENALKLCLETDKKIDLLFTDVIMPGMNGRELSEKTEALFPDIKVLFMSGYTDNVVAIEGVLKPGIHFINKPLVPSQLAKKLREILVKS